MATVTMPSGFSSAHHSRHDLDSRSAVPDPSTSPPQSRSLSPSPPPDHHHEVALLTNKLITAMNHQTGLDDSLANTRLQLETSQARVQQLEAINEEHATMMARGELVWRTEVDRRTENILADLAAERNSKAKVEKGRKEMELELESLTTALFEEANEMVAAARKEKEESDRRNEQLRAQLNEKELLLASQQEQLADLKSVMQSMSTERELMASEGAHSTAPSSPSMHKDDDVVKTIRELHVSGEHASPAPPTSFTHLLSPVLRSDLQACEDFRTLLETSRRSSTPSRAGSGNYGGLHIMAPPHGIHHGQFNGSTSSLSTATTWPSAPGTPNTPLSANSSVASRDITHAATPLKETRFYKRALTEDIEPTLRLDIAPGLSWLNRRAVINSMCEGSLVVEPCEPHHPRLYYPACSLCGESRKGEEYARRHRFKTSENDNAQRYPLCAYCTNRLRSTCDFLGFLRMVKDGHWRADGEGAEATAWEEVTRLRERMFWSRIGGGVIPAFVRARDSPRSSLDHVQSAAPHPRIESNHSESPQTHQNGPVMTCEEKVSPSAKPTVSPDNQPTLETDNAEDPGTVDEDDQPSPTTDEETEAQIQNEMRQALSPNDQRPPPQPHAVESTEEPRGQKAIEGNVIPGAFE